MTEPAGWRWIEAWQNGTISDEDFASLQKLLREQPDARRTLRRYMAMDTALRDRAEARLLMATSEAAAGENRANTVTARRSHVLRREVVAWSTAASCLLAAALVWFTRPTPNQSPPTIAESQSPASPSAVDKPETARVMPTLAQQREQLLVSALDVLHIQLVSDNGGGVGGESGGDIVWSSGRQIGYLRLRGLASNDPAQRQYQLWIVGSDVSGNEIINGGMFPVDRSPDELILPIQADQFVQQPKMFVVSVESSGSGNALTAPLLARADGLGP